MGHVLNVTDGNTTVTCASGGNRLATYTPKSPNMSTVDFVPWAYEDGGERLSARDRNQPGS